MEKQRAEPSMFDQLELELDCLLFLKIVYGFVVLCLCVFVFFALVLML